MKTYPTHLAIETLTAGRNACSDAGMSNVLTKQEQHDIRALGRLGCGCRQDGTVLNTYGRPVLRELVRGPAGSGSLVGGSKARIAPWRDDL